MATITFSGVTCSQCGTVFGLTHSFEEARREDHATFYCPNGHRQYFPSKSREERLQEQLQRETARRERAEARATAAQDQADAAHRSASAYKGQVTKIRKRVANGVCPCCNRSFKDLEQHMRGQHPGWGQDEKKDD